MRQSLIGEGVIARVPQLGQQRRRALSEALVTWKFLIFSNAIKLGICQWIDPLIRPDLYRPVLCRVFFGGGRLFVCFVFYSFGAHHPAST